MSFLKSDPKEKELKKFVRHITGFSPGSLPTYAQALRHHSNSKKIHKNGSKDSNERLEYLGDSILNAIVAEYLFKKYPFENEGFMTELRSKIVSRANLNDLAHKIGLNRMVDYDRKALQNINVRNSIFGNALEAFIGAIFLDKGFKKTRQFIIERMLSFHLDVDKLKETETNFKGRLIEFSQRENKSVAFITTEDASGKQKLFRVTVALDQLAYGKSEHSNKKTAEQLAAQKTLDLLNDPNFKPEPILELESIPAPSSIDDSASENEFSEIKSEPIPNTDSAPTELHSETDADDSIAY